MAQGYDYVIVGGGSAGCVLAARLSEDPAARVCLIEAGGKDTNPLIHMPVGFAKMTTGPLTWGLVTAPQKHANNREIPYAQARVLDSPADDAQQRRRLAAKYGWQFQLFTLMSRFSRNRAGHVAIELSPRQPAAAVPTSL